MRQGAGGLRGERGVGWDMISASALRGLGGGIPCVLRWRVGGLDNERVGQGLNCPFNTPLEGCCSTGAWCHFVALGLHVCRVRVVALMRVRVGNVQSAAREGEKKTVRSLRRRLQRQQASQLSGPHRRPPQPGNPQALVQAGNVVRITSVLLPTGAGCSSVSPAEPQGDSTSGTC